MFGFEYFSIQPYFSFSSPTLEDWIRKIETSRAYMLDTTDQATYILAETRIDVYSQFDQNQGRWKPLKPFTVQKKERLDADPRILHQTRPGEGLRLKDAYKKAGKVQDGKVIYAYPPEKPYAKDHQEGAEITSPSRRGDKRSAQTRARERGIAKSLESFLDDEFLRRIGIDPNQFK